MKVEFEKVMHIAGELLSYSHLKGATEFHLDLSAKNGESEFSVKAAPVRISDEDMAALQKKIHAPRQREIEQNYWGLSGEYESFTELTLVGMMTDEADVECKDEVLHITLKRFS